MPVGLLAGSVDVAPVTPLPAQLLDLRVAQHLAQHRIDTGRQAIEAATDANRRAGIASTCAVSTRASAPTATGS
jgi:hypothetical protein